MILLLKAIQQQYHQTITKMRVSYHIKQITVRVVIVGQSKIVIVDNMLIKKENFNISGHICPLL